MELDQFDRQLLRLVQADAGQTAERLAKQVPLSASAIQRRLRKMREAGVIVRYCALLDSTKVGRPTFFVVAVQVERERPEQPPAAQVAVGGRHRRRADAQLGGQLADRGQLVPGSELRARIDARVGGRAFGRRVLEFDGRDGLRSRRLLAPAPLPWVARRARRGHHHRPQGDQPQREDDSAIPPFPQHAAV